MENRAILLNDAQKRKKYYAVHCRCGHAGVNCYVEIVFGVIAGNGKEASAIARRIPRVKHNKKNAIIDCYEISREEYDQIIKANRNDPYLKCKNIQEQRMIYGFESRIIKEPEKQILRKTKKERKSFVEYKLKKQKQRIDELNDANIYDYLIEKGAQCYENVY
ncbi:MAG: hypothetical protein IJR08_02900 [Bacilli bacterium]|nr:hypothetical protein [Bacilli bacterium]